MIDLTNMSQVKPLLERHGFRFSKSLGQNFLIEPTVCPRIAQYGIDNENMGVIEIGTGIGTLTCQLAQRAKKVVTLEVDKKLYPIIDETLKDFDNITVLHQDVMKTDLNQIIEEYFDGMDVCVCANLPYYITSPILMYLLESNINWKSITVMIQKEVADRLCADVGTKDSGAITLAVRYYGKAQKCFTVPGNCFMPPPKVSSSVIKIEMNDDFRKDIKDDKLFFSVVKSGFAQRRKRLVNSVSSGGQVSKEEIISALEFLGIDENIRIEQLDEKTLKAFVNRLAEKRS